MSEKYNKLIDKLDKEKSDYIRRKIIERALTDARISEIEYYELVERYFEPCDWCNQINCRCDDDYQNAKDNLL